MSDEGLSALLRRAVGGDPGAGEALLAALERAGIRRAPRVADPMERVNYAALRLARNRDRTMRLEVAHPGSRSHGRWTRVDDLRQRLEDLDRELVARLLRAVRPLWVAGLLNPYEVSVELRPGVRWHFDGDLEGAEERAGRRRTWRRRRARRRAT